MNVPISGELLLASGSPRRRELLRSAGLEPQVRPVDVPESLHPGETAEAMVRRLSLEKAEQAIVQFEDGRWVMAADTTVVHQGKILGKPADEAEALDMLMSLRQGSHQVITAVTLIERQSGQSLTCATTTDLVMRDYHRDEVARYVAGGSPMDKAGGYGIQDEGFSPVDMERFEGCFTNVMGLPLCTVGRMLDHFHAEGSEELIDACYAYHPHKLQPLEGLADA
ncbi:MAG: Maf family protein [Anaerolineales bacterium]